MVCKVLHFPSNPRVHIFRPREPIKDNIFGKGIVILIIQRSFGLLSWTGCPMERVSFLADCVLRFAPGRQKREQWKNPFKEQMQEGRSTIKSAKKTGH